MESKETKNEKFIRIAESRTNKILEMIRLLGNCSNKAVYDYSRDEVLKIFGAIEAELRATKIKFDTVEASEKKFKLR
jgi:hypothetical protein